MEKALDGKVSLITGGGSGIGRETAILFAKEGSKVVIANRNSERGNNVVEYIKKFGGEAIYVQTDVSKKNDIERLMDTIISRYGRLDCAFNNAGIDGKKVSIVDCEEDDWEEIINTNLKGTFLLMKYEIKQMLKQGAGSIVNMASTCGNLARPERYAYVASRHGVVGLTKVGAVDYSRKGIRINAVAPGATKSDIFYRSTGGDSERLKYYVKGHPIGRIANPEEIAQGALWLCSDKSSFVCGHTLIIDGGFSIQ